MKRRFLLLVFLFSLFIVCIGSTSLAYTYDKLNAYIDNYELNKDIGDFQNDSWGERMSNIRRIYPNQWEYFFTEYIDIGNWPDIIRVNANSDYTVFQIWACRLNQNQNITIDSNGNVVTNCKYKYWSLDNSNHTYGQSSEYYNFNQYRDRVFVNNSIDWSNDLITYFNNDKTKLYSQYQWTYIIRNGGQYTLYTNGNSTINAFKMRIGQDWNITDTAVMIYYKENNVKRYINNVNMVFNRIGNTNEFFVNLETENLFNDETYYIELIYNGLIWRESLGQRIVNGYGQNPSYSGDNTDINFDLSQVHEDLTEINDSINVQTLAILSGDWAILDQLKQNESGEQARFEYWVGFFNPSGDNVSQNIFHSGEMFGISIDDSDEFGFFSFIYNFFNNLITLLFSYENVELDLGMLGKINSASVIIPNSTISDFIGLFTNPTLLLMIIFFYYRFIKKLITFDLSILKDYDIDNIIDLF